jgi:hypothetical protein
VSSSHRKQNAFAEGITPEKGPLDKFTTTAPTSLVTSYSHGITIFMFSFRKTVCQSTCDIGHYSRQQKELFFPHQYLSTSSYRAGQSDQRNSTHPVYNHFSFSTGLFHRQTTDC